MTNNRGFTLIELMIVIVVIGILAAIAIPNLVVMQDRAKEGSVKANQHTFQIAAEDYFVSNDGRYSATADNVAARLPAGGFTFKNPFSHAGGEDVAWESRADLAADPTATPGIVSYSGTAPGDQYNIKAFGRQNKLTVVLTSGN